MVVVLGADKERIVESLGSREFECVESDPDAEQLTSIKLGLAKANGDALLHLADHPVVPPEVISTIISARNDLAIIPTSGGKGGHPVLIPKAIVTKIRVWNGEGGLRQFWEEHPQFVERLSIENAQDMLIDLDTPEDYARHFNN